MTKTNKRLLPLIFAAILSICAGFALLLSRPAASASAEETTETPTYSETWVINEKWEFAEEVDFEIEFDILDFRFNKIKLYRNEGTDDLECVKNKNGNTGTTLISRRQTNVNPVNMLYMKLVNGSANGLQDYSEWKEGSGKITFYEDTSAEKFSVLRTWLEANATLQTAEEPTPTKYTITFNAGETVLGTVEAEENAKLSALDLSAISTAKEGYTFKGWSLTDGGELLDLDTVTVTENLTLYAVYEKNAEPTDPTNPENPSDPSFEDKVKDFGEKASEWIQNNIGITVSGSAVLVILIAVALVIVFKRK